MAGPVCDARELHHLAVLIGFDAAAFNAYLAIEDMLDRGPLDMPDSTGDPAADYAVAAFPRHGQRDPSRSSPLSRAAWRVRCARSGRDVAARAASL